MPKRRDPEALPEALPDAAVRLRRARNDRGFKTAKQAAEYFGFVKSSYYQHENGTRGLKTDVAERYADAFRVSAGWLLTGEGERELRIGLTDPYTAPFERIDDPGEPAGETLVEGQTEPAQLDVGELLEYPPSHFGGSPADPSVPRVPIRGPRAGSLPNEIDLTAPPLEYVERPSGLASVLDAYGFYVPDNSMAPMHSRGDLRFVHPRKPARQGDSVLVIEKIGREIRASVCLYLEDSGPWLVCQQIAPPAETRYRRAGLFACHRILTTNEIFGK